MKILFIENRYKTFFWEIIAKRLAGDGHEIFWLIQNHSFKPCFGAQYVLPYFKDFHKIPVKNYTSEIKKVISSNRGINYYKIKNDDFIFYYQQQIKSYISDIGPDIIFGESTLFHELLAAHIAIDMGILYLHPTGARYPTDRFIFYKYDTTEPFGGGNDKIDEATFNIRINEIALNHVKPVYMQKSNKTWLNTKLEKLKYLLPYYTGERFNTPSPFVKNENEKAKVKNITRWEKLVLIKTQTSKANFVILFPLHMQPEANIDVWGNKYRDQTELIANIALQLPDNGKLLIKPNPKSKYELTNELLDLIEFNDNIIPLAHTSKMEEVLKSVDIVLTVNGTTALECIFKNFPVVTLIPSYFNNVANCIYIESLDKLSEIIARLLNGDFPKLSIAEMRNYYSFLNEISYKGLIGDKIAGEQYVLDANINQVVSGFRDILLKIKKEQYA